ncbi:PhnA domain-containing protein [Polluticaenibacter yanchengensis]|uniref:PhnA domain-containing protein n=1 Tax=Polluticaenibacter yanchengensis TaxID=3014562 RepID=A0ABT4UM81_9BACT|nr:PhnA domain-containing protein [Chitinophagaceae bacterium LY-5]
MNEAQLKERSNNNCELCSSAENLQMYQVAHLPGGIKFDTDVYICSNCANQLDKKADFEPNHWKALEGTMWSEVPAVQVLVWRLLNKLSNESWAADLLEMLYLEEEVLAWAENYAKYDTDDTVAVHKDSNGNTLHNGDTVVLTKSLDVKGSTLNAKLGTVVKNIRLVEDNPEQIEGKIEGQTIVILTKYLRKQGA